MTTVAATPTRLEADRSKALTRAKRKAETAHQQLNEKTQMPGFIDELTQLCGNLLRLAQKYVPHGPAAFVDAAEIVRCASTLKLMGLTVNVNERFAAATAADIETITHPNNYRQLRNKAIAGFATIADLTDKPAAVGSQEFQRGVREGYRRASDIAISFLEDI
jgi:hypothetical protein